MKVVEGHAAHTTYTWAYLYEKPLGCNVHDDDELLPMFIIPRGNCFVNITSYDMIEALGGTSDGLRCQLSHFHI